MFHKNFSLNFDAIAIFLSFLCLVHCLAMPILITLSPMLFGESYHFYIIFLSVPVSFFALKSGYKRHNNKLIFFMGVLALSFMILDQVLIGFGGFSGCAHSSTCSCEGSGLLFDLTHLGCLLLAGAHICNWYLGCKCSCLNN